MATKNTQKAVVTLDGKSYPLRFDYGAMESLCDVLGARIDNLQEVMGSLKVSQLKLVLWAGMLESAPELADPEEGPKVVAAMVKRLDIADGQAVIQTAMEAFGAQSVRKAGGTAGAAESPPGAADAQ